MFTYPNKVICVTARSLCQRPLEEQTERIYHTGVRQIILREKDLNADEYTQLAERVYDECKRLGMELIIHSFPQTAERLGIGKIHMPLHLLTADLCGKFERVGTSVHSVDDALKARSLGADYVTAGHIFPTSCKQGLPPRGLDFLKSVCGAVDIPVYAIGGITPENMQSALDAGAEGVCIMSGLMKI
jgi:thiamine-phosphate pyrophosphorylase